jgi:hypothetical protein
VVGDQPPARPFPSAGLEIAPHGIASGATTHMIVGATRVARECAEARDTPTHREASQSSASTYWTL